MFDFSFAEIALVVVVAVLFIGPNELPVVIRAIRSLGKELRGVFDEIARESGLEEMAKDVNEITMIKGDDGKMYEAYNMAPLPPKKDDNAGPP